MAEEFIKVYKKINQDCWEKYRKNLLSKERLELRDFSHLEYFGIISPDLANKIGTDYINNSYRTKLIPHSIELLNELKTVTNFTLLQMDLKKFKT